MTAKPQSGTEAENRLVYVRPIEVAGLSDDLRAEIGPQEFVYSVHGENGEQLALVASRDLAFTLARQHDMAPVSVH